jgi:hypothetical protein
MAEEASGDDLAAGDFKETVRHPQRFFRRAFGYKRRPSAGAPAASHALDGLDAERPTKGSGRYSTTLTLKLQKAFVFSISHSSVTA